MEIQIRIDDVQGDAICELIRQHLAGMRAQSPPESVHALGLAALRDPAVTVWSAWIDGEIAGCGALKTLDDLNGEVKSMRTRDKFRGRGVGARVLETILAEARIRGYESLWLETGGTADFAPAHRLYLRNGFTDCGPFGAYRPDPFSRFMTLKMK